MRKQWWFLVVVPALAGLQCPSREMGALPDGAAQERDTGSAGTEGVIRLSQAVQRLVGIKVEAAKYRQCPSTLKAMGRVLAPRPRTAIVSHAFPARVAQIHVGVGDWVEKGQKLVTLESHEVGEAESEYCAALAKCELAKRNLAREERLLKEGIGAQKNFVAAEAEYRVAQTEAEVAEKKLHILGFTEEEVKELATSHRINPAITLFAPIAGKVVDIRPVCGAMVDSAMEILTLIDTRLLWIDAEIYERDIAKVRRGQPVEVRVPAHPARVFKGRVSYIGDTVDSNTRTITVRTEVANEEHLLKPGMFADVAIVLEEGSRTVVVPSAAILEEGDRKIVFVKQKGLFVRREIVTGAVYEKCHQVVSGLEPGEQVVVEGNHQLRSKLQEEVLKAAHVH